MGWSASTPAILLLGSNRLVHRGFRWTALCGLAQGSLVSDGSVLKNPTETGVISMINRRSALGLIASASIIGASDVVLAKEKHHLNGQPLLAAKIKQNAKHKINTPHKTHAFSDVNN